MTKELGIPAAHIFDVHRIDIIQSLNRVEWTQELDNYLRELGIIYNAKNWKIIASKMQEKFMNENLTSKRCRERWSSHANPEISKKNLSETEYVLLLIYHNQLGNCWSQISKKIPKRYGSTLKNNFYSLIRTVLRRIIYSLSEKVTPLEFMQAIYISWVSIKLLKKSNDSKSSKGDVPPHIRAIVVEKNITQRICEEYLSKLSNIVIKNYPKKRNLRLLSNYTNLKMYYNLFNSISTPVKEKIHVMPAESDLEIVNDVIIESINDFLGSGKPEMIPLPNIKVFFNTIPTLSPDNSINGFHCSTTSISSPHIATYIRSLTEKEANFTNLTDFKVPLTSNFIPTKAMSNN